MVSKKAYNEVMREGVDSTERHIWSTVEFTSAGIILKVKGNATEDDEVRGINAGYFWNYPKDANVEVTVLSFGDDTNLKAGFASIPADKQRKWKEGTGGIQSAKDAAKAVEFNDKRTHVTENNFAVGNGVFEVKDGKVYIRGELHVEKLHSPAPVAPVIPDFEP